MKYDLAIVGGGIIGLSIAYQASLNGKQVAIVDRNKFAMESSWAAAGILPDVNAKTALHPIERLTAASHELHREWYYQLFEETGIDYEIFECGTIHLARTAGDVAALIGQQHDWSDSEVHHRPLSNEALVELVPPVQSLVDSGTLQKSVLVPGDLHLRNPRMLKALVVATAARGAQFFEDAGSVELVSSNNRICEITTEKLGRIEAEHFCIACGSWSGNLLRPVGIDVEFVPIRGQIFMYRLPERPFTPVILEGANYMVPRPDGHLLVGSTLENAGFKKETTPEAEERLTRFACEIIPDLANRPVDRKWAGLRPTTFDGFPYIGRTHEFENLYVGAGHFRAGLHLAPITAVIINQLVDNETPCVDIHPFRIGRG